MEVYSITMVAPDPRIHPIKARMVGWAMHNMAGLTAVKPMGPFVMMVFPTVPHAEKAREKLIDINVRVVGEILRGELTDDFSELKLIEPVEGWAEEEAARIERNRAERTKRGPKE